MATLSASDRALTASRAAARPGVATSVLVALSTALALIGLAVSLMLTPPAVAMMRQAAAVGDAGFSSPALEREAVDTVVRDLVFGGDFTCCGPGAVPLYTAAEMAHLGEARLLLYGLLGLALVSMLGIATMLRRAHDRRPVWRAVASGGLGLAVGVVALGAVAAIAFEPAFELFHRIFFPGGNWAFDAGSRLIRMWPLPFWMVATWVLGVLALSFGLATWWLARRRSAAVGQDPLPR